MARAKNIVKSKEPVKVRFKNLSNGNKSIYLDCYRNGKRSYEFLKLYLIPETNNAAKVQNANTLTAANKIKAERIIELTNGEAGLKNASHLSKLLLVDLMKQYEEKVKESGNDSYMGVQSTTKSIIAYCGANVSLRGVDKDFCLGYIDYLKHKHKRRDGKPISPTTAQGFCVILSAALNMAVRNDIISENPFDKIASIDKIKRREVPREYLTIAEVKKLIATPFPNEKREIVKNAFLFSCYCGLRRSDIYSLTWGQITFDGSQWRVTTVMEKTEKPIYLPLSKTAMKWLPERGESGDNELVFDFMPSPSHINNLLAEWANAAGITYKNVTYHVSRHTFGTMLITLGVDLYTVSKLMGHSNIETTKIYAKIVNKKKDDAVNRVDDVFIEDGL